MVISWSARRWLGSARAHACVGPLPSAHSSAVRGAIVATSVMGLHGVLGKERGMLAAAQLESVHMHDAKR